MLLALGTWASRLRDTRASLARTCDHVRPRHPGTVAPAPPRESHTHSARSTSLRLGRQDALGRDGRRRP
eukprot:1094235-Prymnesium_polylepis.1